MALKAGRLVVICLALAELTLVGCVDLEGLDTHLGNSRINSSVEAVVLEDAQIKTADNVNSSNSGTAPVKGTCAHENLRKNVNLQTFVDRWRQQVKPVADGIPRHFLITYGPPGSGKSVIFKDAMNVLETEALPVEIFVDDMVESVPGYQKERARCKGVEETQALYWGIREDVGKGGLGINGVSEALKRWAIGEGYNVVIEMTGRWLDEVWFKAYTDDIRSSICKGHSCGYQIVAVYPLVSLSVILNRVRVRAIRDEQEPAPADRIIQIASSASKTLSQLPRFVDTIMLFDNDGSMGEQSLLFAWSQSDSVKNLAHCRQLACFLRDRDAPVRPPSYGVVEAVEKEVRHNLAKWVAVFARNESMYDASNRISKCREGLQCEDQARRSPRPWKELVTDRTSSRNHSLNARRFFEKIPRFIRFPIGIIALVLASLLFASSCNVERLQTSKQSIELTNSGNKSSSPHLGI